MAALDPDTVTTSLGLEHASVSVSRLVVVEGPDAGLDLSFVEPLVSVGSGPAATLRLRDTAVSRLHCELERDAAGVVRLRDLGSKNGTWALGCRVRDLDVAPNLRIQVGTTVLAVGVESRAMSTPVWRGGPELGPIFGASPAMQAMFATLARAAQSSSTVLLTGETGTGKELVARTLHDASDRRDGPFVVVDGTALSRTLGHSELFGHVRGAFTDAVSDRAGAFERAHGGTLFLDEVGEIPLDVQPQLLRVLERREVQRLGDSTRRPVDVRVIAATHRPLPRMVNAGTFREDLLYRLLVVEVRIPPLRERPGDVPHLAHRFLHAAAPNDHASRLALEEALAASIGYAWPGNVRELRNFVERIVATGTGMLHGRDEGPARARADLTFADAKREWVDAFERQYLLRLLDESGGTVSEAARRADMDRGHLSEMLKRHGIRWKR